ncbi:RPAP1-like protein [Xylariales sp. PMI_506]|nr:RPAP1-like protein [Xylariales sp. PMI_506]
MDPTVLIFDVKEKETSSPQPPSFPQVKSSSTGFPEHKKRTRISAFKQQRQSKESDVKSPSVFTTSSKVPLAPAPRQPGVSTAGPSSKVDDDKRSIDRENQNRLATMSATEIEEARQELFNGLDPKILEMLLKRANLDENNGPSPFDDEQPKSQPPEIKIEDTSAPTATRSSYKKVHFEDAPEESGASTREEPAVAQSESIPTVSQPPSGPATTSQITPEGPAAPTNDDDEAPPTMPPPQEEDLDPAPKPHWPHAPAPPDLDPSDPDFLASLHQKYFPSLPADPTKLAWMAPLPTVNSPADYDSPYHPSQDSIPVNALRFNFRGTLLPPRIARAVPVSKGLHHHGEAPEAAGYTVAELARLARSAVPGQRCIAYQTLGRVLFRLGRGEFGRPGDTVANGVWSAVVEGKVMESLYEEASIDPDGGDGGGGGGGSGEATAAGQDPAAEEMQGRRGGRGHRSAYAFAVEAIWLFEKGGWKERLRRGK